MHNNVYMYNGVSLRKYCIDNGLYYDTILKRIQTLKKNKELSMEEIIDQALNKDYTNNKINYNGFSLKQYCKENNINYNTLLNYIHRERLKNPNSTLEEMINEFNNRTYIKKSRYKYNGMTLRKYCEKNNINYLNVLKYINNYKHNDNKPEISDEELINKAIELYTEIFYKGISLKIYCEYKKNLRYTEIRNFILNEKKENPNISEDELIDKYIEIKYKRNGKYMYKGILLTDYCKNNNLNADLIRKSIYRYKLTHADLSEDEIVRRIVENDREGLNQPTPLEPEKKIIDNEVIPRTKKKKSTKVRILEKLSDLPREDLEFLLLKYQHNYTNLDLASYFNMTLVEVVNKDEELVKSLREKYKIKVLKK